ncbi:MAG: histidinol-phosphatase HisJ family protein [Acutalibacteraceae bacterium]|nr:histidinol-phosphatase HisJ family protein [Acutalibacteraceae bacterium]
MICDLHTHTAYCDGDNTPEEMLLSAIEKGFNTYGFSSHSHLSYDESWNMSHAEQKKYVAEVLSLREKYKGKIEVLLGTEYDLLSDNDLTPFDYVIGSCHSLIKDGSYVSVDHSEKIFVDCVEKLYGGDYYFFCSDYFKMMSTADTRREVTFFGHFDLVNKFNKDFKFFSETDSRYTAPMLSALEKLAKSGKPFEINTQHTFRHSQTEASASALCWLSALSEMGGQIIINSDAHKTDRIGFNFDRAKQLAKKCGFKHYLVLNSDGFTSIPLK